MTTLLIAIGIVFGVTWLVLLVDCIRRKEFGGPIGSRRGDKVFWIVSFVLLDPLMLGLYLLFVRRRWAWDAAWRSVVFLAAFAAVLALRIAPVGEVPSARLVAERGPDGQFGSALEDARCGAFGVALQTQLVGTSSSFTTGTHQGVGFRARFLRIQTAEDDPALRFAALGLGEALTELGLVDRVECVLDGEPVLDEGPGPDLTVLLDLEPETDLGLLVAHRFVGVLHATVAQTPWAQDALIARGDDRVSVARLELVGAQRIDGWSFGFAIGTSRHEPFSGAMTAWLVESVAGAIGELADDMGVLPKAPESWHGEYRLPEDPSEVAASHDGELVHASSGFLCDAHAVWEVDLGDDVEGAVAQIRGGLERRGFRVWRRSPDGEVPVLEARRDGERVRTRVHLTQAREPRPYPGMRMQPIVAQNGDEPDLEPEPVPSRYVLDVFDDFSDARLQALAGQVSEDGGPVALGLALARFVPAASRDALLERSARLREPGLLLAAARVARDAERPEVAAGLVRRGYEMARVRGTDADAFESLAEELGVTLPEKGAPLDLELLREIGIEQVALGDEMVRPLRAGEPVEIVAGVEDPVVVTISLHGETIGFAFRLLDGGRISGERSVAELEVDEPYRTMGFDSTWLLLRVSGDETDRRVHFRVERSR